jgi:hypothetical protein
MTEIVIGARIDIDSPTECYSFRENPWRDIIHSLPKDEAKDAGAFFEEVRRI